MTMSDEHSHVHTRKNRERFTLNFRKHPCISIDEVHGFIDKLNQKERGQNISLHEVVSYFIRNHTEKDVQRIQEESMSLMDRIHLKYLSECNSEEQSVSFEEYLGQKLKVK